MNKYHEKIEEKERHKKMEAEKEEKRKALSQKIKSLKLEKGQLIKITRKDRWGGQVQVRCYFTGIYGDEIRTEAVVSHGDDIQINDDIKFENIEDISLGNEKDVKFAEEEKKGYGPFADGSRYVYQDYHDYENNPWDAVREIRNSRGKTVLRDNKMGYPSREGDKEIENREIFDKVLSDLRSGLTLEECWYQPQREKERIKRDEERIKKMKKFDPGIS